MRIPNHTRRVFLTVPGEPLEIAPSPIEAAIRFGQFAEETGVPDKWILSSPLSSMPLPVYPTEWAPGKRRWEGTSALMMWHPLMWLPERVASRYPIQSPDSDTTSVEEDDVWALRVCQELVVSGAYDPETGTWVDVLSTIGLDVMKPDDLARVQAWLDGGQDPELDGLDTTSWYENPDDPDWAIQASLEQLWPMRVAAWALASDSLLDACEDLADLGSGKDLGIEDAIWAAKSVAQFGGFAFAAIPEDDAVFGRKAAWWGEKKLDIELFDGDVDELLRGPVEEMYEQLMKLHDYFWPLMEQIAAEDEAIEAAGGFLAVPSMA